MIHTTNDVLISTTDLAKEPIFLAILAPITLYVTSEITNRINPMRMMV